jgi:hypothetical protein
MVYAEKLLGYPCNKRLIFIDKKIQELFTGNSWVAKAIVEYDIKVFSVEISEQDMKKLRMTKELQQRSNQKKSS